MNSNFPYNVGANRLMVAEVNRDIILPTEYKDRNGIVKISNVSKKDALTYGIVIKVGKNVEEHLPGIKEGMLVQKAQGTGYLTWIKGEAHWNITYHDVAVYGDIKEIVKFESNEEI